MRPRRSFLRLLCLAPPVFACACGGSGKPAAPPLNANNPNRFYVYCVNGKVQIDERDIDEMKAMRGSKVSVLEEKLNLKDAERCAAERGGVGQKCSDNRCVEQTPQPH